MKLDSVNAQDSDVSRTATVVLQFEKEYCAENLVRSTNTYHRLDKRSVWIHNSYNRLQICNTKCCDLNPYCLPLCSFCVFH